MITACLHGSERDRPQPCPPMCPVQMWPRHMFRRRLFSRSWVLRRRYLPEARRLVAERLHDLPVPGAEAPAAVDFDEQGRWIGTCPKCGTDHDGRLPGTFAGDLRCMRVRAEAMGATHLVDQVDALMRDADRFRDEKLRELGVIPPEDEQ